MAMNAPVPEMADRAAACADRLRAADEVLLASHIDADGLTSAAVASTALERAEIPFETLFSKQLDEEEIASIAATTRPTRKPIPTARQRVIGRSPHRKI